MNAFAWWVPLGAWLGAALVLLGVAVVVHTRERIAVRRRAKADTDKAGDSWRTRHLLRRTNIGPGGKVL